MNPRHAQRRGVAGVLALVLFALVAACGESSDGTEGADPAAGAEAGRVVLVTYDSFALPEGAAERFEELTGATIEVRGTGDAGTMLTAALLAAGAPEGDVIFGIDNTLATRALGEDLLMPFVPDALDMVPERYRLEGEAGERLVPIDTGDVCVNVDSTWYEREGLEPPQTMDDLVDEQYRSHLVVQSPVTSSPGLAFLLGTIDRYGDDGWPGYWQALRANDVSVRPSWDDAYYTDYTVSGGDRPLVVSYASSPPAEVIYGDVDEPASTVMVDSCVEQVEYAGLLRGAENPELGQRLIEFMLSEPWQRALPEANFVFPVVDVELPAEFERWAVRAEDPARVDPDEIDERRDEWIEQWRELRE
jgi:thiamine transport system substrate-binding protein